MNLKQRLKAAWTAFLHAQTVPYFAVIYDSYEGLDASIEGPREEYYERFGSPAEANRFFREAFPQGSSVIEPDTERLVMVLGPIDGYR
ncbi:MAG: hypothetical protein J0H31_06335 [Alphaproteobacteria bacterium]|nr:hypothetical protein [Alphaproteobacteria bacterium]